MKLRFGCRTGQVYALFVTVALLLGSPLAWADHALPDDEKMCMALNIYHEARGEPLEGMRAVAAVTVNRVKSSEYPNTVCGVVWQPHQFSWTTLSETLRMPEESESWQESLAIAEEFSKNGGSSNIGDATHYHNDTVRPSWSDKSELVAQVGRHSFYSL